MISVIIPVYNVEQYLDRCIKSILKQTYDNLEIILVNDGSKDSSGEICDYYKRNNNNVKVLHQENRGLSEARNAGLSIAQGEFIGFVDSDDYVEADMYEYLFDAIIESNSDIAVGKFIDCYNGIKKERKLENSEDKKIVLDSKEAIESLLCGEHNITSHMCNKLFRKELFNNLRFAPGKLYEDSFIIVELLIRAKCLVSCSKEVYYYDHREGSIVESSFKNRDMDLKNAWEQNGQRILRIYPELKKQVEYRYFWTCFYLLDKCILCGSAFEKCENELFKILRTNMKKIVLNKYFKMPRRLAAIILWMNLEWYKYISPKAN